MPLSWSCEWSYPLIDMIVGIWQTWGMAYKRPKANGNAKFSEYDIRVIRASGDSPAVLAGIYDCSVETIRRILRKETWWWVDDAPPPTPSQEINASFSRLQKFAEEVQKHKAAQQAGDDMLNELTGGKDGSTDDKA